MVGISFFHFNLFSFFVLKREQKFCFKFSKISPVLRPLFPLLIRCHAKKSTNLIAGQKIFKIFLKKA
jgi:hypothetical protein